MKRQTLRAKIEIQAPPERIWDALTRPEILTCWFAESGDVDPRPGGHLQFGGRYSFSYRPGDPVGRPIVDLEEGRFLTFLWPIGDGAGRTIETPVTWRVEPAPSGSSLEVVHDLKDFERGDGWGPADAWSVYLNGLTALMEGKRDYMRFDYSRSVGTRIGHTVYVRGKRETVFEALHTPEKIRNYFTRTVKRFEPVEGGKIDFGWKEAGPSKVITFEPPQLLSYDWRNRREDKRIESLRVDWRLEGRRELTKASVLVSGFVKGRNMEKRGDDLEWASLLAELKRYIESGRRAIIQEIMDLSK